jgi:hypothetical protein
VRLTDTPSFGDDTWDAKARGRDVGDRWAWGTQQPVNRGNRDNPLRIKTHISAITTNIIDTCGAVVTADSTEVYHRACIPWTGEHTHTHTQQRTRGELGFSPSSIASRSKPGPKNFFRLESAARMVRGIMAATFWEGDSGRSDTSSFLRRVLPPHPRTWEKAQEREDTQEKGEVEMSPLT